MTGKSVLLSLNVFIELICFLLSFLNLRKGLSWKLFIPYTGLVVAVESLAAYFILSNKSSAFVYYPFLPFMVVFYLYQLNVITGLDTKQRRVSYFLAVSLLTLLAWEFWAKRSEQLPSVFIIFNNLVVTVFCFYYLQNIFRSDKYENLFVAPRFWIIIGLLIHNFGSISCFVFIDLLNEIRISTGLPVRQIIMLFLNFCLYGSWSYAFICNKYQHNKLSS